MFKRSVTSGGLAYIDKKALVKEEDKLTAVVSCLEKEWNLSFSKKVMLNRMELYTADYKDMHCRVALDANNFVGRIVLISNITNEVLYSGLLKDDVNYYIRILNSLKARKRVGKAKELTVDELL